jgi:hypothetical protein
LRSAADAIERGDALLLAAIDVPDDLRIAHVDLAIPALSLARIDAFAQRYGLTRSALFVEAVNRWAVHKTAPRERRGGMSNGPTLFDFDNPLELKVEKISAGINPEDEAAIQQRDASDEGDIQCNVDDITAELVRLLEGPGEAQPTEAVVDDQRNRLIQKRE